MATEIFRLLPLGLRERENLKDGIRENIEDMKQPFAIWLWNISLKGYDPVIGVVVVICLMLFSINGIALSL